jgi:ribonucleoside-triphosphate reductase (formate)
LSFPKLTKLLSSQIRCQILQLLSRKGQLSFTEIMRELDLDPQEEAGSFGYHIKALLDSNFVEKDPTTGDYFLPPLGMEAARLITNLEDLVSQQPRSLYVRSSSMAIEPFNRKKIEEALIREAGAPRKLADEISREVEERVKKLQIKYLTAPLIREMVNTVLVEKGVEEYRHLLTRLGKPVHDVTEMIREVSNQRDSSPRQIQEAAGNSILNEYLLLRVLPAEIADAHLAGRIHLCNTATWFLNPQNVNHDLRVFLRKGLPPNMFGSYFPSRPPKTLEEALETFSRVLLAYRPYVADAQSFDYFNIFLAPYIKGLPQRQLEKIIRESFARINDYLLMLEETPRLSLGIETSVPPQIAQLPAIGSAGGRNTYSDFLEEALVVGKALALALDKQNGSPPILSVTPLVKLRSMNGDGFESAILPWMFLSSSTGLPVFSNIRWQQNENASYNVDLTRLHEAGKETEEHQTLRTGILDTIAVNLPRIAYSAKGNDDLLFEGLIDTLKLTLNAFKFKAEKLTQTYHDGFRNSPISMDVDGEPYYDFSKGTANIALTGLYEAVEIHSEESLHESVDAESLALKVVKTTKSFISETEKTEPLHWRVTYVSPEPVAARLALLDNKNLSRDKTLPTNLKRYNCYQDYSLIPYEYNIPLEKRVNTEKAFDPLFDGGHALHVWMREPAPMPDTLMNVTKKLFLENPVGVFSFSRDLTLCSNCGEVAGGLRTRCGRCGSSGSRIGHLARRLGYLEPIQDFAREEYEEFQSRYKYIL